MKHSLKTVFLFSCFYLPSAYCMEELCSRTEAFKVQQQKAKKTSDRSKILDENYSETLVNLLFIPILKKQEMEHCIDFLNSLVKKSQSIKDIQSLEAIRVYEHSKKFYEEYQGFHQDEVLCTPEKAIHDIVDYIITKYGFSFSHLVKKRNTHESRMDISPCYKDQMQNQLTKFCTHCIEAFVANTQRSLSRLSHGSNQIPIIIETRRKKLAKVNNEISIY